MTKRFIYLLMVLVVAIGVAGAVVYATSPKEEILVIEFDTKSELKANQVGFYAPIENHHGNYWEYALVTPRGIERVNTDKNVLNSIKVYKQNGTYGTKVFATEEEAIIQLQYYVDEHYLNPRLGR